MDGRDYKVIGKCLYLMVVLLAVLIPSLAQDTSTSAPSRGDNSKVNQQDRSSSEPTADQQKNNKADLEITRQIRRSLMRDKSLSTYAHNVKIITQQGKVVVKGPVRSDDEKSSVLAKAAEVAGPANVTDQMTVVPKKD